LLSPNKDQDYAAPPAAAIGVVCSMRGFGLFMR
jgi:hypothetical protein